MSRDEIARCKDYVRAALCIMEEVADAQPEVHVLISLRELLDDINWLEAHGEGCANVVRLSDVRHLRAAGLSAAGE
jgi:hypothetical protein